MSLFLLLPFSLLSSSGATPPHLIVILADDLGWADVSWHNPNMHTPHLARLAEESVTLNRSYFHPKCSPSRAALLTGYHPHVLGLQRAGVGRFHPYGLDTNVKLLPQYLEEAGYSSHLVGKWHLGYCNSSYLPHNRGFHSFFGQWSHVIDYYTRMAPVKDEDDRGRDDDASVKAGYDLHYNDNITHEYPGVFSTEMYADRADEIISSHNSSKPLFLMVAFQAPHNPFNRPPERNLQPYSSSPLSGSHRAATVTALDAGVGTILESLQRNGLLSNSLVFFSSDNGGAGAKNNRPLRGKKEQMYEGGMRVISLIRAPQLGLTPNTVWDGMSHVTDWLSTFLHAAGLGHRVPDDSDSHNLLSALADGQAASPREVIVHSIDQDCDKGLWQACVRRGNHKLIWGQSDLLAKEFGRVRYRLELYDVVRYSLRRASEP